MDALNDKINSLSSEELDLLNSDSKLLSDFKNKYSSPQSSLGEVLPKMLPMAASIMPTNAIKDIGQNIAGLGSSLKAGLYDIPKAIGALPGELAHGLVSGQMLSPEQTQLGQFTKAGVEGIKESIPTTGEEAVKAIIEHPVSTASLFMGLGGAEPAGIESGAKGFAETLSENANSKLAKFNKSLAKINENATKMGGQNLPVPTQEELAMGTKNVIQALKGVVDEHGKILNDAKSSVGLPASETEKDASIRKFGNKRNINLDEPLGIPDHFTQKAPVMEDTKADYIANEAKTWAQKSGFMGKDKYAKLAPSGALTDEITSNNPKAPPQAFRYAFREPQNYEDGKLINTSNDPNIVDPKNDKFYPTKDVPELGVKANSQMSINDIKEKFGYDIQPEAQKLVNTLQNKNSSTSPMAYKISPTKTPEDLNTEISRFMKNQDYIKESDKTKAASYYQDKINNYVDWAKEGDDTQGLLKSKYKQLQEVIQKSSPKLQEAKTKWSGLQKSLDLVQDKIDPKEPGKTQAYLKSLFTSDSPTAQDKLKQLAYLEKLSGKPIITELFKQFAGQSFEPLISRHYQGIEAAGAGMALAAGHPLAALTTGLLSAAQSPRILGGIESAVSKTSAGLAKYGPGAIAQIGLHHPFNTPDMQSLKDRLSNASK